jgi:superfamily II DNA or RNA helicase/very-short-patch-repair endonuclease
VIGADSFLEYAFLRWVLQPAVVPAFFKHVVAQYAVAIGERRYRVDYAIVGATRTFAVELDGFAFHSSRQAFTYDRLRQNDLQATGLIVARFSYDAIRAETARCVRQLQELLRADPLLRGLLVEHPRIAIPAMDPSPLHAFDPPPTRGRGRPAARGYFATVRDKLNLGTLRACQVEAYAALANYYATGGRRAACVMAVGAGKTATGVVACLACARRRALIVTPGSVIRGVFDRALDHTTTGNVLYGLPGGPLIPGAPPPRVLTLDREDGAIRAIGRDDLLAADIIVTNFHALGDGTAAGDLLAKLRPGDIDLIVVDEAHIAAAASYQRLFAHFADARTLLMSACFQRLDGRPIAADVVYRYLLVDSIADGNAKNPRIRRFAPDTARTTYEVAWPDGRRREIVGREALLAILDDERQLARITARSDESIRLVMRAARAALERQATLLAPVKPRALFAALGERHAEQVARIANEEGIPTAHLHHAMGEGAIRAIRARFERDSGDLQGLVQLRMLGQGYDFPPIAVVAPLRPYRSFGEFYQFIGRGIRVIAHPALAARFAPGEQFLDIVYHAELGLDEHIEAIYRENDMDPLPLAELDADRFQARADNVVAGDGRAVPVQPEAVVLFERGRIEERILHDAARLARRGEERDREGLASAYAAYAQLTDTPVPFEEYVRIMRQVHGHGH